MRRPGLAVGAAAALLLMAPALGRAGSQSARLLVSVTVVRSISVSVHGEREPLLGLQTLQDGAWLVSVPAAERAGEVAVSRSDYDPRYLVVTVLADAPPRGTSPPPLSFPVEPRSGPSEACRPPADSPDETRLTQDVVGSAAAGEPSR